ncbi:MAG: hypothetical protein V4692_14450, partial [Bdellovibrionota bacterium]
LIARILAAVLRQRDSEARILADSFLSLNPDASIKSAENRRDEVSWSTVYRWCTTIYSKASDKTIASAVVASCLLQVKNNAAAEKFAKGAFDRSAFDPQIRGMYAFTLQANGKFSEAKALFSGQDDRILPKLALAALAKICEKEKNLGCAQRYWARLLEHDPADPIAFLGLIEARAELQDVDGAKQVIKQSLSRQPASTTDDLQRLDRKLRAKGISLW